MKSVHSLIVLIGLSVLAALMFSGCRPDPQPAVPSAEKRAAQPSRPSVALRVLVVNDRPLAEAIARLSGEWAERSGGTFATDAAVWSEILASESIEADVAVFPSRYLGELCEREWLRPVRSTVLESNDYQAEDIFPLARRRLTSYRDQVMAVPLGVDLLVMCYRPDAVEGMRREPPATWDEYANEIETTKPADETRASPPAIWEPVQSWGARLLLARAASYAVHPDSLSVLFDSQTMRPRIADPPFVRALDELRQATASRLVRHPDSQQSLQLIDPRAASWRVATGHALSAAIGLPPAGHREIELPHGKLPTDGATEVAWAPIPGAKELYHPSTGIWQTFDRVRHVPLLGAGDRLAAVTTSSRNAASAFQLLAWLAGPEVSSQFARAGEGTLPVRRSLASSPLWYDSRLSPAERRDLGEALSASLSGQHALIVPRIPGVDQYLAALDKAVQEVVFTEAEPALALQQVADAWEQLTDQRGRQQQRQAYLRHLGIEP